MFYYVEFLRATRALRIVGIVLGLALLGGLIFRLSFVNHATPEAYITDIEKSPTAHLTETRLPDGSTRTIVDDPQKHRHAVITRQGRAFTMDLTEPADSSRAHGHDTATMGSLNVNEDTHAGVSHLTVSYSGTPEISWAALFVGSTLLGLLAATILAGPLAKENDGHLELAWTKPVSREAYAGAAFAIDIATIVLSQLACIVIALVCILMWAVPAMRLGNGGFPLIVLSLLVPIAWYACLTAFSASVRRGPGMVVGCGWFAALIIPSVMAGTSGSAVPLVQAIHAVFKALAYIDPIVYFPSFSSGRAHGNLVGTLGEALMATAILSVAYIAVAVLQWRRVEA
jgi:hypothetical protein